MVVARRSSRPFSLRTLGIPVACLLLLPSPFFPAAGTNDPPAGGGDVVGDWTVTGVLPAYRNVRIHLTGNLTVQNGGRVTFDNVTLVVNSSAAREFTVTVMAGGRLDVLNGTTVRGNETTPRPYYFRSLSGSTLRISGSTVRDAGNMSRLDFSNPNITQIPYLGVSVEASDAVIDNSTFTRCAIGLLATSFLAPTTPAVRDSVFDDNTHGLGVFGVAAPQIERNTYSRNTGAGFLGLTLGGLTLGGGTYRDNGAGIAVAGFLTTPLVSLRSITAVNNSAGIVAGDVDLSLSDSLIRDSAGAGVIVAGNASRVQATLTNVTLMDNANGTGLHRADLTATDVVITGSAANDFVLNASSTAVTRDSTFNRSRLQFNDTGSWLQAQRNLDVQGAYENLTPAAGAGLDITNRTGASVAAGLLDANGTAGPFLLTAFVARQSGVDDRDPHVAAAAAGDYRNTTGFDVAQTSTLSLVLRLSDILPPAVVITSPTAGAFVNTSTVHLEGTATDNLGLFLVELSRDGSTWIPAGGTAIWGGDLTMPGDGGYTLLARATDLFGNTGTANTTVVVDSQPPLVAIASPAEGLLVNRTVVRVTGTTNGTLLTVAGGATQIVNGTFDTFAVLDNEGNNTVAAVATDQAGNSATAAVTVIRDTLPPGITIESPAVGAVSNTTTVVFSGTATDPSGVVSVEVATDGATWRAATTAPVPGGFSWNATLLVAEGDTTLSARATDRAGHAAFATANITVTLPDTTAPTVRILAPADGATLADTRAEVSGIAGDARGIAAVDVSLDGIQWTPAVGKTNWTVILHLVAGNNTIRARATDTAGLQAIAQARVSVVLPDRTAPEVTIVLPKDGATVRSARIRVTGTASDDVGVIRVTLRTGGSDPERIVQGTTNWSLDVLLGKGGNVITVEAVDAAGNEGNATIYVRYVPADGQGPTVMTFVLLAAVIIAAVLAVVAISSKRRADAAYLEELRKHQGRIRQKSGAGDEGKRTSKAEAGRDDSTEDPPTRKTAGRSTAGVGRGEAPGAEGEDGEEEIDEGKAPAEKDDEEKDRADDAADGSGEPGGDSDDDSTNDEEEGEERS